MAALEDCLGGNSGYTAPATMLWRDIASAREHLSYVLTPEGEPYDLIALVLEVSPRAIRGSPSRDGRPGRNQDRLRINALIKTPS